MRKLATLTLPLLLLFSVLMVQEASASHLKGCDLTYQCVDHPDSNKYFIQATIYRDCEGINLGNSITLNINSASCGINQNFTFNRVNQCPFPGLVTNPNPYTCEVTPVCPQYLDSSCCTSNSPTCIPGTQMFIYADTIQFPQRCNDWIMSTSLNARNASITNLVNPQQNLYCEAMMNNLNFPCNSSPLFTSFPVPYLCRNVPYSYNQGAVDLDGDSISYQMITPRTSATNNMTFSNGLNQDSFLVSTTPVTLGTLTGQLSFTPSIVQEAVSAMKVEHLVGGQLAGYVIRDMQWNVVDSQFCSGVNMVNYKIEQSSVSNGLWVDSGKVAVCPGDSISFSVTIVGDSLVPFSNFDLVFPNNGDKDSVVYGADSITYWFGYKPDFSDTGNYVFTITGVNITCPLQQIESFPFVLEVARGTYAGLDQVYCEASGPISLNASGGTSFSWRVLDDGFNTYTAQDLDTIFTFGPDTGSNVLITPLRRFPYYVDLEVTSNLISCKNTDTVRVEWVPTFFDQVTAVPDTICRFETTQLFAGLDPINGPLWGPYTFSWQELDNGTLTYPFSFDAVAPNQDTIQGPQAMPMNTISYVATIVSDTGCRAQDTITVVVSGEQPVVDTVWGYPILCAGDSVQLEIIVCEGYKVFDDFNGGIDLSQWQSVQGGVAINQCMNSPAGGTALWMNQAGTRQALTPVINTSRGGDLSFWFMMGNQSFGNCNWPDNDDTIKVEYTTDGGATWNTIQQFNGADRPSTPSYTQWTQYTIPLPLAALSATTQFRVRHVGGFFNNGDVWAIDDFYIECCEPSCTNLDYTWTPATGLSNTDSNIVLAYPSTTTNYNVNIVPSGTDCDLDYPITVSVASDYNHTLTKSTDSICKGYDVTIDLQLPDAAQGPYTVVWTGSGTIQDPSGGCIVANSGTVTTGTGASFTVFPCETTTWFFDIYSDSGCYKRDSVTVAVVGAAPEIDSVYGYPIACLGESVNFFIATGNLLFCDFEDGVPCPDIFAPVTTGIVTLSNCGSLDGSNNTLYMNSAQQRQVTTVPLDLSFSCTICFDFILAGPGGGGTFPCEDADITTTEYVDFEYSTDGGATWNLINNFPTLTGGNWTPWANYCYTVPIGARTPNTILRFNQPDNSGTCCDHWAIDNFLVDCGGQNDSLEYCWYVTPPPPCISDSSAVTYTPTQDSTWLKYQIANPGGFCPITDSILLRLVDNFTWSSTQSADTICKGEAVTFTFDMDSLLYAPYEIVWTSSGTALNLDSACTHNDSGFVAGVNDTASFTVSPCNTTYYYVSITSNEGCRNYDTFVVYVAGELPIVDSIIGDTGICVGESVELVLQIGKVDFTEDFDSLSTGLWDTIQNGTADQSCGSPSGFGNSLFFSGIVGQPRQAQTVPLDVTGICDFTFDINVPLLNNGACNSPETNELIDLEYSVDGGTTWVNINTYAEQNGWQNISVTLPAGAISGSTIFRWRQQGNPGSNIDNWALDNVVINCAFPNDTLLEYSWNIQPPLDTTVSYTGSGSLIVTPPSSQWFSYTVAQPGGFCPFTDSVFIKVGQQFGHRLTQNVDSLCKGEVLLIDLDSLDASEGPYDVIWYSVTGSGSQQNLDSACIANSSGSINTGTGVSLTLTPCNTQYYIFEMTSANGCKIVDSVLIFVAGEIPIVEEVLGYPFACEGEAVTLDLKTGGTNDLCDDFETGGPNPAIWDNTADAIFNTATQCQGTPDGSAWVMQPVNGTGVRQVWTQALDLSRNCQLVFDLLINRTSGGGCEPADPGEGVEIEYSTTGVGGPWLNLASYPNTAVPNWAQQVINLPAAAQTSNTIIRFRQPTSTVNQGDDWAIDNVCFICDKDTGLEYVWEVSAPVEDPSFTGTPLDTSYFSTGTGTFVVTLPATDYVTYTVSQVNGFCPFTDSILVEVVPNFNYTISSPDDTICKNQTTDIVIDLDSSVTSYFIEWFGDGVTLGPACNSGESDTASVFGPNYQFVASVSPCNTTTYYFTIFSDSGCRKIDSFTIYVNGESPVVDILGYTTVCIGDSVQLDLNTCVGNVLFDEFDAGIGTYWDDWDNGVKTISGCNGPSPQGGDFLVLHPTESIETRVLDLTYGGELTFYLRKGEGFTVDCGAPETNEPLFVEYTTTGGPPWTAFPAPVPYPGGVQATLEDWTFQTLPIPAGAIGPNTQIRFRVQGTFNSTSDAWHVDDVKIQCCDLGCSNYSYSWTPNTNINTDTSRSPWFSPTNTTTYLLTVAPFGTNCVSTDSVTINVAQDFTWTLSANDTICKFDSTGINLTLSNNISSYTVNWSSSSTFNSIGCDNGSSGSQTVTTGTLNVPLAPCKTTSYYFEILSDSGCRHLDTITIVVSGQNPRITNLSIDRICEGDSAIPSLEICGFDILTDDLLDTTQWDPDSLINVNFGTGFCTPPPSNTDFIIFNVGGAGTRIVTQPLDLTTAETIQFWLWRGDAGTCGSPDANEDIELLYWPTAGIVPLPITSWDRLDLAANNWEFQVENLPVAARQNGIRLMFRVLGTPSSSDVWAIDDILIECCDTIGSCANFDFTWTGTSSVDNANAATPTFWPTGTTPLILETSLAGTNCTTLDTVVLEVASKFNWTLSPDTSVCRYAPVTLTTSPDPGSGPYDISWNPFESLNTGSGTQVIATPNSSTTYTVSMTSDSGCTQEDQVTVTIAGEIPLVSAIPSDTAICPGENLDLDANVDVLCGLNGHTPTFNFMFMTPPGAGAANSNASPFQDSREVRYQMLFLASDLQARGLNAGYLDNFTLRFSAPFNSPADSLKGFVVKMGCTGVSTLAGSSFQPVSDVVYQANSYSPDIVAGDWNLNFQNIYDWDGVSNIVIEICYDNFGFPAQPAVTPLLTAAKPGATYITLAERGATPPACQYCCRQTTATGIPNVTPLMTFGGTRPNAIANVNWTALNAGATITSPNSYNTAVTVSDTTQFLVTVDDNGCIGTDTATVNVVDDSYNITVSADTICVGDTSQITVTTESPATFNWTGDVASLSSTNSDSVYASPTTTATYYVDITIGGSCVKRDTVTIHVRAAEDINLSNVSPICGAGSFDTVTATVVSGRPITNYNWLPSGQSTPQLITDVLGNVFLDATINGCVYRSDTAVVSLASVNDSVATPAEICAYGSVTLTPATPNGTYDAYKWYNAATGAQVGSTYSYTYQADTGDVILVLNVTDGPCDYFVDSIPVSVRAPVIPGITPQQITRCPNDGAETLTGLPGYASYEWYPGGSTSTSNTFSAPNNGTTTAYYYVGITAAGCRDTSRTSTITFVPDQYLGVVDTSICIGDNSPITFNAPAGYTNVVWRVIPGGSVAGNGPTFTWNNGTEISLYIEATDVNGCTFDSLQNFNINASNLAQVTINNVVDSFCVGDQISLTTTLTSNEYLWMPMDIVTNDPSLIFTAVDTQSADIDSVWVIPWPSGGSCFEKTPINIFRNPVAVIENAPDTAAIRGTNLSLVEIGINIGVNSIYEWTFSDSTLNGNNSSTFNWLYVTDRVVYVYEYNAAYEACFDMDSIEVNLDDLEDYIIPNIFTPNNDGVNDIFGPVNALSRGGDLLDNLIEEIVVYDRWGNLVFNGSNVGWNGKNNKGEDVPAGSYVYYLVMNRIDPDNSNTQIQQAETGTITLVR